ncbi:TraR/DksA C4-type zinc finger protein [Catellatospora sp. NEAU-YM18]|nr:TraR/DksA C4-type zinc finger protein [Catellatospora tritici]
METGRQRLERARAEVERQIAALAAELADVMAAARSANADDEHDPEGATIGFERAQVAALLAGAQRRLAEFDDALLRFDVDTYGVCESCGLPISAERLAVLPSVRTCLACARRR